MNVKSAHDLEASLSVLAENVRLYCTGNVHAYRPVAVELRKLLCDTQRGKDNSLIIRLFPDLRLHPLLGDQTRIDEFTTLYIPGTIRSGGHAKAKISPLFNEAVAALPLDEWLRQKLFDKDTTIRDFIRSVADKEAAHSDLSYNSVLRKTKTVKISGEASLAAEAIISIGRYITKALAIRVVNGSLADIAEHIREEYHKQGRGAAVLILSGFAACYSEGVPLEYQPSEKIAARFERDAEMHEKVQKILEAYQPSNHFLLLVIDLNDELWLYQQVIEISKT